MQICTFHRNISLRFLTFPLLISRKAAFYTGFTENTVTITDFIYLKILSFFSEKIE